ncbi:unnamed protein product, partial [Meganyctiphanes norvegica]
MKYLLRVDYMEEDWVSNKVIISISAINGILMVQGLRKNLAGLRIEVTSFLAHFGYSLQILMIKKSLKRSYEENLVDDLKSELGGHFEDVMVALMTPMPLYLAQALHKALKGKQTNAIIEILCTRDKPSIENIKKAYMEEHGTELTEELNTLQSEKFRQFLIAMITEDRSDVAEDLQIAKYLSQKLFDAGAGKSGVLVEDEIIEMLTKFSYPMLRMAFREYFNIHDDEFQNVIETKFPEELKDVMKNVYESITSPPVFFAKQLNNAIAGAGTDDPKLIRLVVSRCEIDMENIKEEYEKLYNETLEKAIKGDTSGDYKKGLLALIGC